MLTFQPWKTWITVIVCLLGVLLALPNVVPQKTLDAMPSWVPTHRISYGLDLQGGSHLLLEVDLKSVNKERLNGALDGLRTALLKEKIGYTQLAVDDEHLVVALRDAADADKVKGLIAQVDPDLATTSMPDGKLQVAYTQQSLIARQNQVVDQSIEIIRRRVDETGTKEPTIQREGDDRILLQLPGIDDPQHMKDVLNRTAKMTFQLVDESVSPEDAKAGHLPPGDELLSAEDISAGRVGQPQQYVINKRVMVDGGSLTGASASFQDNAPVIQFKFDSVGARRFADATRANVRKRFAIVLDKKVISAPVINEPITGGSGVISGSFTVQSANDLALLLRAGALPASLSIIEERTVGPDLGADSVRAGTTACLVAVGLVAMFMVVFYGLFGIYANIALFFNLCLLLAALSTLGATLTLPGIAGIALTLGMAVDANVLVNERIREEARHGRSVISAIDNGFSRAYATIIDANVTHLIAGSLLFELGSGPVKGFAVTLCLGILTSLFTTMLVSRLLVVWWLRRSRPKALPI
ncbi:MAG TPA: protein translocase subunit SecD [Aliidongia sp.]|uniref:protein translocase subunit SecD n=1 Tax=Aliidongia sp. TaxID=1914230 RepID=UPI002DDCA884|nr:protein translocase subunit SecD [Aliidongia sp.]HEV2673213.1 protein translocase subunit SecD [Aliidongia sp.]